MSFDEKIVMLRNEKGMTQEELASLLKVSRQTISKWENGECVPRTDKIKSLSEIFNCEVGFLLTDEEPKEEKKIVNENKNIYNYIGLAFGSILIIVAFAISFFVEVDLKAGHSGFIGFLETWSIEAVITKAIFFVGFVQALIPLIKIIRSK